MTNKPARLPRCEIESLCVLAAIPKEGCTHAKLAGRLGLSPLLEVAISESIEKLHELGWIQNSDGCLTVTPAGQNHLKNSLLEYS